MDDKIKTEPLRRRLESRKLWVTEDYYCRYDETGRILTEDTYEGALGYVIKLYNDSYEQAEYAALKIPKLIGSTHRENAYINDLMFQEENTVTKIRGTEASGLLSVIQTRSLRGPLRFGTKEKLAKFDNGHVFMKFEAGKPPIIVVRQESGEVYPELESVEPSAARKFISNLDIEVIRKLSALATKAGKEYWKKTVFLAKRPSLGESTNSEYLPFNEVAAAGLNPSDDTWYTCLPSVIYTWAYGTLQEVISSGKAIGKKDWTHQEHLRLALNICRGIEELHNRGYVHADIRPANILFTDRNVNDIQKYLLADYGSLAMSPQSGQGNDGGIESGHTVLGPVLEGERSSVFYAPERYKGQEREIANRAIVLKNNEGYISHIVLGWQKNLNKKSAEEAVQKSLQLIDKAASDDEQEKFQETHVSEARLQAGDRVRIQDYIFELTGTEQQVDGLFILPCDGLVSKMSQGRIAIRNDDHSNIPEDLPADRTIEMLQWSAATDIYSLGILLLYTIYRNSYNDPEKKYRSVYEEIDTSRDGESLDEPVTEEQNEKELEDSFRRMVTYLSNPQFFELIWRDLESLRQEIEEQLGKEASTFDIALRPFPTSKYSGNPDIGDDTVEKKDLRQQAIDVTNIFTQLVPGTRRVCASLDFNIAAFVFIMHFVMACMHRRKHLISKLDWMDPNLPFCDSRTDLPKPEGPAKQARLRLERLSEIFAQFENDSLKGFQIVQSRSNSNRTKDLDEIILPLSSDTDFNIRQQKITLEKQNEILEKQKIQLNSLLQEIHVKYKDYQSGFFGWNLSKLDRDILGILENYENSDLFDKDENDSSPDTKNN